MGCEDIAPVSDDGHEFEIQAVAHTAPLFTFPDRDLGCLIKEHAGDAYHRESDDVDTDQQFFFNLFHVIGQYSLFALAP